MARLFWLLVMAAVAAGLAVGASYIAAYVTVGDVLGSPPPEMGTQSTALLWRGAPELADHPRVWRFAFSPTRVPGAPTVRIYVTPTGHLVATQPADLTARIKELHPN